MLRRISVPLLAASCLVGCESSPKSFDALPPELRTATVVAALEPGAAIPDTATFSWMPGSFVRVDTPLDPRELEPKIRSTLEEALRRRGLYLVPDNRGDLWIGYAVATENAVDGDALDDLYGIHRRGGRTIENRRGALVVDVVDRASRQPLWRGSVAILTEPDLPEEVRQQRLEHGVEQLLDAMKPGY